MEYLIYSKEHNGFVKTEEEPALLNESDYFVKVSGTGLLIRNSDYSLFIVLLANDMNCNKKKADIRILGKDIDEWKFIGTCFDMGMGQRQHMEEHIRMNRECYRELFVNGDYERLAVSVCHSKNGGPASIRHMTEMLKLFNEEDVATEEQLNQLAQYIEPYFKFNIAYEEFSKKISKTFKDFMKEHRCDMSVIMDRIESDCKNWKYEAKENQ